MKITHWDNCSLHGPGYMGPSNRYAPVNSCSCGYISRLEVYAATLEAERDMLSRHAATLEGLLREFDKGTVIIPEWTARVRAAIGDGKGFV